MAKDDKTSNLKYAFPQQLHHKLTETTFWTKRIFNQPNEASPTPSPSPIESSLIIQLNDGD